MFALPARRWLVLVGIAIVSGGCLAHAAPAAASAASLLQQLKDFQTTGSVLYVAAHPDDENNRLLPYLALGRGYRTAYLSLTRGDGGQNLIGSELGEDLGVIRTQELLAARRIDGAAQFFSRARDFGFSKDSSDTLVRWDRQQVLADVVRVIRQFRPDVIITRFSPIPGGTHGHHTASTILALEAFKEAADPKAFPEQLDRLAVWQAKRIVWNSYSGGGRNGDGADATLRLDDGGYDAVTGQSFGEIAAEARSMHRTQGQGRAASRGPSVETFDLLAGEPANGDLMDGIDTGWGRLPGGAGLGVLARSLLDHFNPFSPAASVPAILELRRQLALLPAEPLAEEKRAELDSILVGCLGLFVETTVEQATVVPGEALTLQHTVVLRAEVPIRWLGVRYPSIGAGVTKSVALRPGIPAVAVGAKRLPEATPLTQPYWLRRPGTEGMFEVADPALIGRPESPIAFPVQQVFEISGQTLVVDDQPVQVTSDPARGEVRRSLEVIPPIAVAWKDDLSLFQPGASHPVEVDVTSARSAVRGTLDLVLPAGWSASPASFAVSLPSPGDRAAFSFILTAPARAESVAVTAEVAIDGKVYNTGRVELSYEHIPPQLLQNRADLKAVSLDLQTRGTSVGYLSGAGDQVADSLSRMGYQVTMLQSGQVAADTLHRFDAVVLGVRAFNTRGDLEALAPALFAYAEAGGTLIVQYNTFGGLRSTHFAPYPITLSELRVTHTDAPVTFLAPTHPVLTTPNRITSADFEGWVQERARYIPRAWDSHFVPILASNDPGEAPLDGTLLVAAYGKGYVVYTGLSFFHELPAGVPGAYRLWANLISLGK